MDKASERRLDAKKRDGSDADRGVHTFGPGNKIDRMESMCCTVSPEVVGLSEDRIRTNNYAKVPSKDKSDLSDVVDEIMSAGPPLWNVSKPNRVF